MRLALLLLLAIPLHVNAAVWTVHAEMKVVIADDPDIFPIYRFDGTFTTDASGITSWDISGAAANKPDVQVYRLTNNPCKVPGNPDFSDCFAHVIPDGFIFRQDFGGRANYNLGLTRLKGVLVDGYFSSPNVPHMDFIGGTLTQSATAVPEPETFLCLGVGLLLLWGGTLRKKLAKLRAPKMMRFSILLLLVVPMYANATVWVVRANMLLTFAAEWDDDPHFRVVGTFTTDASGVPQTWNISAAPINRLLGLFTTNNPCSDPGNPFSGCSAESKPGGFGFRNWYGARAINEFSFAASNGVLTAGTLSTAFFFADLVDGTLTQATAVPEPSAFLWLGTGFLLVWRREIREKLAKLRSMAGRRLALFLLLTVPMCANATVWTIHADMSADYSSGPPAGPGYKMDGTYTTDAAGDLISWSIGLREPAGFPLAGFGNIGCQACGFKTSDGYHFQTSVGLGSSNAPRLDLFITGNTLQRTQFSWHQPSMLVTLVSGTITAIPQPSTYLWLGLGLLCLTRLRQA